MKILSPLLATIVLCLFAIPSVAQSSKTIDESFDINDNGRVHVDTYKGSIDVTTWDRDVIEIEAIVEEDNGRELVELTDVNIRKSGRSIYIETDYSRAKKKMKRARLKNYSLPLVHYTIRMPRSAEVKIEDYKSDIYLEGIDASVDLETYKGEVDIRDVQGDIRLDTYKGDVRIVELAGSLSAETYKGNIEVEFDDLQGDTAFDTYRGDIEVTLPRGTGFDLDADLGNKGDLDASFNLGQLRKDDNYYRGSVQGGGPRLEFDTYRGSMRLRALD